ncbi:hypothetical protein KJ359_000608 [Pestalotiopsis sp. 9143b]|nr:hypothetical protein KJ359_000608 [Pestalotiopsis sp. 9143b]
MEPYKRRLEARAEEIRAMRARAAERRARLLGGRADPNPYKIFRPRDDPDEAGPSETPADPSPEDEFDPDKWGPDPDPDGPEPEPEEPEPEETKSDKGDKDGAFSGWLGWMKDKDADVRAREQDEEIQRIEQQRREEQERRDQQQREEQQRIEQQLREELQCREQQLREDLQRREQQRLEQQRLEQERLEQQREEQQRLEQERLEQERLEQERLEQERLEQERLEQQEQGGQDDSGFGSGFGSGWGSGSGSGPRTGDNPFPNFLADFPSLKPANIGEPRHPNLFGNPNPFWSNPHTTPVRPRLDLGRHGTPMDLDTPNRYWHSRAERASPASDVVMGGTTPTPQPLYIQPQTTIAPPPLPPPATPSRLRPDQVPIDHTLVDCRPSRFNKGLRQRARQIQRFVRDHGLNARFNNVVLAQAQALQTPTADGPDGLVFEEKDEEDYPAWFHITFRVQSFLNLHWNSEGKWKDWDRRLNL